MNATRKSDVGNDTVIIKMPDGFILPVPISTIFYDIQSKRNSSLGNDTFKSAKDRGQRQA